MLEPITFLEEAFIESGFYKLNHGCLTYPDRLPLERNYHEARMRRNLDVYGLLLWESQYRIEDRRFPRVLDFFSRVGNVAIEVDGTYHERANQRASDRVKDYELESYHSIQVFRIENGQVDDFDFVFEFIRSVESVARMRQNQMEFKTRHTRQG